MNWKNKVIAVTPFVCAIVFFILAIEFKLAHPGWTVFLLVPLMPFLLGKKKISVSIVVIIIYILVSIILKNKWNITWVILLLIPVFNIILVPSSKSKKVKDDFEDFDEID